MKNPIIKAITKVVIGILVFFGAIFIALIIYYWPVIDRFVNWCEYYPNSVSDCREE